MLRGGVSSWQTHLRAIAGLIPLLHQGCSGSLKGLQSASQKSKSIEGNSVRHELTTPERQALDFSATTIIWFDTLSCVSTGCTPLFMEYIDVFENAEGNIRFDRIVGCENWAVVLIMETCALANSWRSADMLTRGNLRRQATVLNLSLTTGIIKCLDSIEAAANSSPSLDQHARTPHLILDIRTYLFAVACQVYLQTMSLAAFPQQPHIQNSVSQFVSVVKRFQSKHPTLARSIVWPIFITGCLATPELQNDFRSIVHTAQSQAQSSSTLLHALDLMENCWEARRKDILLMGTADLTQIISASEYQILLL